MSEPGSQGHGDEPVSGAASDAAPPEQQSATQRRHDAVSEAGVSPAHAPIGTLAGRVWVAIAFAVVLLVLLIIFIAENSRNATISFLGAHGTISLGLAMLISGLAGVVITLLVGTTRILQLRTEVRRHSRRARRASA